MTVTFDTQQVFRELAGKGGFSDAQAEILINVLRDVVRLNLENLATKNDLRNTQNELSSEINLVRAEIEKARREIDQSKGKIESLEERVYAKFEIMQKELTIRLGGIMVVGLGVLATLVTLF